MSASVGPDEHVGDAVAHVRADDVLSCEVGGLLAQDVLDEHQEPPSGSRDQRQEYRTFTLVTLSHHQGETPKHLDEADAL